VRAIHFQGEDLFVGKDVAATLGYGNTRQAIIGHCKAPTKAGEILKQKSRDSRLLALHPDTTTIPET
jgi:prophage antirepressor-like protein